MPKDIPLTARQLRTLRVCWRLGKATGREIYDELLLEETVDYRTVAARFKTLAARGYLRVSRKDGKSRYLEPVVSERDVVREEIRRFLADIVGEDEVAWEVLAEELRNARD